MSARPPILIVGAGIPGLVAALALLRRGIDVEIYEQAAELREIGAGLQIAAIIRGSRETARRFHNPILADPAAAAAYDYDARTVPLGPDIPAAAQP